MVTEHRREYLRNYQREWVARRRREWFEANGPCVDCDSWEQLELDHVDASTKVDHKVWSWSAERRGVELAKCVVRCADCHERKTNASGERARGETLGKLTETQVKDIRFLVASGYAKRAVARAVGVDEKNIRVIVARQGWKHVD